MPPGESASSWRLTLPDRVSAPIVLSSPHSGRDYLPEFLTQTRLDPHLIRSSEDAFVDRLFSMAPDLGLPLLCARLPRAFLDLNRHFDELDPAVVEGVPRPLHNPRIASGLGVIPRVVAGGRAIYAGKMPLAQAQARILDYWHPYHARLRQLVEQTHRDFGQVLLLDCHSMPHEAILPRAGLAREGLAAPQVVLGDRYGASAGGAAMDLVEAAFLRAGFRVARNSPFAGAHITQSYGRPARGYHAIQIEIDRALYMDEARIAPRPDFETFRDRIGRVIGEIAASFGQSRPLAAE